MTRSTLTAATVAALAAAALGGTASAALAVPSAHRSGPARSAGAQHLRQAQLRVLREIEQREVALAAVASSRGLLGLSTDDATAVRANLATDRAALAALADQLPATTTAAELLEVAGQVRSVRPANYELAVSDLRRAERMQRRLVSARAAVSEAESLLVGLAAQGHEVGALSDGLEAVGQACDLATTAAATAAELARALVATSGREDRHSVVAALSSAGDALEVAEEHLEVVLAGLEAS